MLHPVCYLKIYGLPTRSKKVFTKSAAPMPKISVKNICAFFCYDWVSLVYGWIFNLQKANYSA